jgi:hypothetical protein
MDLQTNYITPDIKLSAYKGELYKAEAFDDHILVWLISGKPGSYRVGRAICWGRGASF